MQMALSVLPDEYIDLSAEDARIILERVKREHLSPVNTGDSLHCWNEDFIIDGAYYTIVGEISSDADPIVQLVKPRR